MIQDIGDHKWDINFKDIEATEDSRIMFFCGGKLLVIHKGEDIIFPMLKETTIKSEDCGYLFSLDGEDYFRCEIDKEDSINIDKSSWEARNYFRMAKPKERVLAAVTGMHLDGWYRKNRFCGACGKELVPDKAERMLKCPECGNMVYPRINPAVIVGVTDGDKILLTKYRGRSYKNYALVAGFNEIGESFEDTVRREVLEEVGLEVKNIRYYKSQPWGFSDNILAGYYCEVYGSPEISMDKQELSVAEWVHRDELPDFTEGLSLTQEMIEYFGANGQLGE